MSFRIEFLSGAASDLLEVHREISNFSEAHAEAFSLRLERRLTQLAKFPEMGPPFSLRFRRLVLGKFPYAVFYLRSAQNSLLPHPLPQHREAMVHTVSVTNR